MWLKSYFVQLGLEIWLPNLQWIILPATVVIVSDIPDIDSVSKCSASSLGNLLDSFLVSLCIYIPADYVAAPGCKVQRHESPDTTPSSSQQDALLVDK